MAHFDFVNEAISELLVTNRIFESEVLPHNVNPLSVSIQSSGKKRLILDLRFVNKHVWKQKVKYEDLKVGPGFSRVRSVIFVLGSCPSASVQPLLFSQRVLGLSLPTGGGRVFTLLFILMMV